MLCVKRQWVVTKAAHPGCCTTSLNALTASSLDRLAKSMSLTYRTDVTAKPDKFNFNHTMNTPIKSLTMNIMSQNTHNYIVGFNRI